MAEAEELRIEIMTEMFEVMRNLNQCQVTMGFGVINSDGVALDAIRAKNYIAELNALNTQFLTLLGIENEQDQQQFLNSI